MDKALLSQCSGWSAFWPSDFFVSDSAVDPKGVSFPLTREGRGAIGLFVLALIWWISEVVPIGVTAITVGVLQVLFAIRPAGAAFKDFMDPAIFFIFGSIVIGIALMRSGLTKRIIYKILGLRVSGRAGPYSQACRHRRVGPPHAAHRDCRRQIPCSLA